MAELLKIKREVEEFKKEYFDRNSQAEESRQRENRAALRIQSWFRACRARAYLSHLHKKAITIQKIWRGFTARARFRQMVKAAYLIMKMNFYEEMAVRIQRRWRGFFVRKYIHNFYARKRYLEGLSRKNALVRRELGELEELQKRERDCLEMVKEQTAKVYKAHRLHHLLSTKQCPGVFNSPFRPAPHEMELLLRQVKYQTPTRVAPSGKSCLLGMPGPAAQSYPGTLGSPLNKTTGTCFSPRLVLPPIATKKQQLPSWPVCHRRRHEEDWPLVYAGLFREPGEVWEQRVRCPDLTLRLQTSYTHLEDAQSQLRQHKSMTLPSGRIETGSRIRHLSHNSKSFTQPACGNSVSL